MLSRKAKAVEETNAAKKPYFVRECERVSTATMDGVAVKAFPLRDKKVVFELGSSVPWKRKQSLRKAVVRLGGIVSYVLTKEVGGMT